MKGGGEGSGRSPHGTIILPLLSREKKVFCPLLSLISRGERGGGMLKEEEEEERITGHEQRMEGKERGEEGGGGIFFKGLRRI